MGQDESKLFDSTQEFSKNQGWIQVSSSPPTNKEMIKQDPLWISLSTLPKMPSTLTLPDSNERIISTNGEPIHRKEIISSESLIDFVDLIQTKLDQLISNCNNKNSQLQEKLQAIESRYNEIQSIQSNDQIINLLDTVTDLCIQTDKNLQLLSSNSFQKEHN